MMPDTTVTSDGMVPVLVALIGMIGVVGSTWLQNRKTRRLNTEEHGTSVGFQEKILSEVRDVKADVRSVKADMGDAKADIRLIKQEATTVRDRLDNLERKAV